MLLDAATEMRAPADEGRLRPEPVLISRTADWAQRSGPTKAVKPGLKSEAV